MSASEPYIGSGPLPSTPISPNTASVPYDRIKMAMNPANTALMLFKVFLSSIFVLLCLVSSDDLSGVFR
jgi:hypothetical protein